MKQKLDLKASIDKLLLVLRGVGRYGVVIFVVVIAGLYGYLILRIGQLNTQQPSTTAINAQNDPIRAAHVDTNVVKQLETLRDNSVDVQALFNQARNNPFQE